LSDKIVITCALTGGDDTFLVNPAVPVTPGQIATAALEAERAGAAIAHIHVRDPGTGKASGRLELFQEVVERLQAARSGLIIELSCGRGGTYIPGTADPGQAGEGSHLMSARERVAHIEAIRPELCSLDVGTVTNEKSVFLNVAGVVREMAERVRAVGTKPDLDVFDLGHIEFSNQMIRDGLIEGPPLFQLVLGVRWGAPATCGAMVAMRGALSGAHWSVTDLTSEYPQRTLAQAILLGGSVRVGLEDSLYIEPGVLAKSNAQQVERTVRLARALGFDAASPDEARKQLGLASR